MYNINDMIEKRRTEIVEEGVIASAIAGIFKGLFLTIIAPYAIVLLILMIIMPFYKLSKHKDTKRLEELLKKNPELSKGINGITKGIYDSFCKLSPEISKFFRYKTIDNYDIKVVKRNEKKETLKILVYFMLMDSEAVLKHCTGYTDIDAYFDSIGHDDPDSEPHNAEVSKFFDKLEETISTMNSELRKTYNGISIDYNYDGSMYGSEIDREYPFTSLGIYNNEDYPAAICLYINCNMNSDNLNEEIKKKVEKLSVSLKPLVEKRLK